MNSIVIIGGGLAGAKAAEALREGGYGGGVTIVSREAHVPYERPPLSKGYLLGTDARDAVFPLGEAWYTDHDVKVFPGATATAIDRAAQTVSLDGSRFVSYDALLLATGSDPVALNAPGARLDVPGARLQGVHYLRTLGDSEALRDALQTSRPGRLVIVGDGWIGLEVAAAARHYGWQVSVIGQGDVPLQRVLGTQMGRFFAGVHQDQGVRFYPQSLAEAIEADHAEVTGVRLVDGTVVPADAVLVAIGARPGVALAAAANLRLDPVSGGIVVNAQLRSRDPAIFAAGDIAAVPSARYGRMVRVEHWATALNQGTHAARAMLGAPEPYERLPYFFTDQYDVGMEYLGFVTPGEVDSYEVVLSGSVPGRQFVAFWARGGRVDAAMAVNVWNRMDDVESLIRSESPVEVEVLKRFAA